MPFTTTNDSLETHHPLLGVFDANNINHERNKYHLLTIHRPLDSEDDFRTCRRNVNQCHHHQLHLQNCINPRKTNVILDSNHLQWRSFGMDKEVGLLNESNDSLIATVMCVIYSVLRCTQPVPRVGSTLLNSKIIIK